MAGYPSNFNRGRQVYIGAVEEWRTLESDGVAGGEHFRGQKYVAGVWARWGSLDGNAFHKYIVAMSNVVMVREIYVAYFHNKKL